MICARCGHDHSAHGRRGYGSCGVGKYGGLAAAINALRYAIAAGLSPEERTKAIDAAMLIKPCGCKRFLMRPKKAERASAEPAPETLQTGREPLPQHADETVWTDPFRR